MTVRRPARRCMIYAGRPAPDPFDEIVAGEPDLAAVLVQLDDLFVEAA